MGYTRGEFTERCHLFGLNKLALRHLQVREAFQNRFVCTLFLPVIYPEQHAYYRAYKYNGDQRKYFYPAGISVPRSFQFQFALTFTE